MPTLSEQIEDFRRLAEGAADAVAPDVSAWSVGKHVDHCTKAMETILDALGDGRPPRRFLVPSPVGCIILLGGRIPRGRAQAPPGVLPEQTPDVAGMIARLDDLAARLDRLGEIPGSAWIRHFAAGHLRKRQAIRFLEVHNAHHRAIVRDVLRAANVPDPGA